MSNATVIALFVVGAYLIGGIPFGFLIGKMRGVDVRTVGSKNIGATNVYRTVGHKWGFLAFFCDFLKGLLPTLAAVLFAKNHKEVAAFADLAVWTGLACVVGHTLTPYMKFKGGKGVVTVWISHYISLGSCLAAAFLAVMIWIPTPLADPVPSLALKIVMTVLGLFVIYKHKSNIVRLAKGCENKIY